MKRSARVRLFLMGSASVALAACGDDPQPAGVFQTVDECVESGFFTKDECSQAIAEAQREHPKVAPKYATKADCEADFGVGKCEAPPAAAGGTGAATTTPTTTAGTTAATTSSGGDSGSFWMPLMMGYMVGQVVNNMGQRSQPLYRPNVGYQDDNRSYGGSGGRYTYSAGSWRTAGNVEVSRGTGVTTVGSSTFRSSTPSTTTISRGGFGARASSVGVSSSS